jgi:hypothetical protein
MSFSRSREKVAGEAGRMRVLAFGCAMKGA